MHAGARSRVVVGEIRGRGRRWLGVWAWEAQASRGMRAQGDLTADAEAAVTAVRRQRHCERRQGHEVWGRVRVEGRGSCGGRERGQGIASEGVSAGAR